MQCYHLWFGRSTGAAEFVYVKQLNSLDSVLLCLSRLNNSSYNLSSSYFYCGLVQSLWCQWAILYHLFQQFLVVAVWYFIGLFSDECNECWYRGIGCTKGYLLIGRSLHLIPGNFLLLSSIACLLCGELHAHWQGKTLRLWYWLYLYTDVKGTE